MILAYNLFAEALKHGAIVVAIAFVLILIGGCGERKLRDERKTYRRRQNAGPVEIVFKGLWIVGVVMLIPIIVHAIYIYAGF